MRKLRLDLEELAVESFMPESMRGECSGTVHAHDAIMGPRTRDNFSCQVGCTLQMSCNDPCATG
jgi:hypothetical protein